MIGLRVPRVAVVPLAVLVVAACGKSEPASDSEPRSGRLVVQKSLAGLPVFIEGSVTHLRSVGEDGVEIVDGLRPLDTLDIPLLDRAVPAGTYELTAVERPCEGHCGMLDPPFESTRCDLEVVVRADRTTRVAIVLDGASGTPVSDCSATTRR